MIIAGKYSITNKIGYGGFSTVYEAKNMQTYEIVAIKISTISPKTQDKIDPSQISLLHREAKVIMKFKHQNGFPQIRCYGSSKCADKLQNYEYVVMDRLGNSLEELKAKCGGNSSLILVSRKSITAFISSLLVGLSKIIIHLLKIIDLQYLFLFQRHAFLSQLFQ